MAGRLNLHSGLNERFFRAVASKEEPFSGEASLETFAASMMGRAVKAIKIKEPTEEMEGGLSCYFENFFSRDGFNLLVLLDRLRLNFFEFTITPEKITKKGFLTKIEQLENAFMHSVDPLTIYVERFHSKKADEVDRFFVPMKDRSFSFPILPTNDLSSRIEENERGVVIPFCESQYDSIKVNIMLRTELPQKPDPNPK